MTLTQKLSYLTSARGEDEATLLAKAVDAGIEALYREAVIEAYLAGHCTREDLVNQIGPPAALEIDQQRDALRRDVEWGLAGV